MADSQLLKGILEACVLALINQGETYGYELLVRLEEAGLTDIGEGTLYPVLTRLDKQGHISCRKGKSPLGPIRKYYTISPSGLEKLQQFKEEFNRVTASANHLLFQEEN